MKTSVQSSMSTTSVLQRTSFRFAAALVLITIGRLVALVASDINLGTDETQYWFWSQTPDFGYFSKPPMIAWMIGATTFLFGNDEWAVRLAAPLLHAGTATFLFLTAKRLYGEQAAFWTGLAWLAIPGVSLSSMVMSTDALLLFFWSVGLYLYFELSDPRDKLQSVGSLREDSLAALLGLVVGLGFLSKYAMIYFLPGAIATAIFCTARLSVRHAFIAIVIAAAVVSPNIVWNVEHDFQTVSHTAANANWQGTLFNLAPLGAFLGAQFGVFGPLTLALLLIGLVRFGPRLRQAGAGAWKDIALLCFAAPPILIVSGQAFISRAHANWAAAAYPAATLLIAAWAFRARRSVWLKSAVGINLVAGIIFTIALTDFSLVDKAGFSKVAGRARGWDVHGAEIARVAAGDYDAVMADDREIMGAILYYGREIDLPVVAWNSNHRVDYHYEAFNAFAPGQYHRILYVTERPDAIGLQGAFSRIERLGESSVQTRPGKYRRLYLFELSGHRASNIVDAHLAPSINTNTSVPPRAQG